MSAPARIIFAGSGEFGLPSLKALVETGFDLVEVITQPDRPAGRGRALTPTPIGQWATAANLPLRRTGDINSESLPPADLMVVIAFGQKIAPHIVNHARLGSINLHASLLPKYRGAAPINWAIIRGERQTGNSIIRLAPKMDAGAVLAQSKVDIGDLQTAGELHDVLAGVGADMVFCTVEDIIAGTASETPQDESEATIAPKLSREKSKLDFTRPAAELANQIRGMYPWPGCRVRLINPDGRELDRITLVRARPREGTGNTIGTDFRVGGLEIVELQPEGKRPMSLAAYRNGHKWEAGMRLESVT